MKKEWKSLLAVLGIAVLAAAVALMPACDSGGGCDLELETLNGNWAMESGELVVGEDCPPGIDLPPSFVPPLLEFEVEGNILTITNLIDPEEEPKTATISCSGDRFEFTFAQPEGEPGCVWDMIFDVTGEFTSEDSFTATFTLSLDNFVYDPSNTDCELMEFVFENCIITSEITGTRTI